MFFRLWRRSSLVLFLAGIMAGCSALDILGSSAQNRVDECTGNRARCQYEGSYDKDEKAYAEQEAARLNRAQSIRLGRHWLW